jgi:hypothetical protein
MHRTHSTNWQESVCRRRPLPSSHPAHSSLRWPSATAKLFTRKTQELARRESEARQTSLRPTHTNSSSTSPLKDSISRSHFAIPPIHKNLRRSIPTPAFKKTKARLSIVPLPCLYRGISPQGSIFVSYAQADARDRISGAPIPEAPRNIWDAILTKDRLPFRLRARSEFEYVAAKPVGDGFTGPAVTEFRGQLFRPFLDGRITLSTQFLIAHGYTGETTEVFAYPTDPTYPTPFERVVGVPLKSYITVSWTYHFTR